MGQGTIILSHKESTASSSGGELPSHPRRKKNQSENSERKAPEEVSSLPFYLKDKRDTLLLSEQGLIIGPVGKKRGAHVGGKGGPVASLEDRPTTFVEGKGEERWWDRILRSFYHYRGGQ